MNSQEEKDRALRSQPQGGLESPFLGEELFVGETETRGTTSRHAAERAAFQHAFEQGRAILIEPEELEETESFDKEAHLATKTDDDGGENPEKDRNTSEEEVYF